MYSLTLSTLSECGRRTTWKKVAKTEDELSFYWELANLTGISIGVTPYKKKGNRRKPSKGYARQCSDVQVGTRNDIVLPRDKNLTNGVGRNARTADSRELRERTLIRSGKIPTVKNSIFGHVL